MSMITLSAVLAGIVLITLVIGVGLIQKRHKPRLKTAYYEVRWRALQKLCSDKSTWPLAVIDADKLLDDALRRLKYKGKTMGERLVAAQRDMTDNDSVWYAHKLRNKLVHEDIANLKEVSVKDALKGIRQALRDLGALK
jgi:hypothetical protein